LLTVNFDDSPEGDETCSIGNVTRTCFELVENWRADTLNNVSYVESTVFNIYEQTYTTVLRINGDEKNDLSTFEQILIKRGDKYKFMTTSELKQYDQIVFYKDDILEFIDVESIEVIEKETKVFLFYREPWGLIAAESMLAYNGCKNLA
jgi:hypothetical protein